MEPEVLGLQNLLNVLLSRIESIQDPHQASNAQKYSLASIILGAFSVFFMQCDSFLEHQRQMDSREGQNNAQTLFGIEDIPTVPQIRNVIDGVCAPQFFGVFGRVYQMLQHRGLLSPFEVLGGYLVALDGTQYHRSQNVFCAHCSHRTHKNGNVTYSHSAILPVIVAPGQDQVISFAHKFIRPQDGAEKQDSEVAAAKRWVTAHAVDFEGTQITLLGDDLYSRRPMCETVVAHQMNFIFTCLPESHPALYAWVERFEEAGTIQTLVHQRVQKKITEIHTYRYVNDIVLTYTQPDFLVNWCELVIHRESDGQVLYHNAWITRHPLDHRTICQVADAGRCRWKTENENHNILKTKGYHLEHNFGHGKNHLSATLLTLNLLAFLFHTVLHLVDERYQKIRKKRGTRQGFFGNLLSLTKYLCFDSWQHLLDFMLYGSNTPPKTNSS
jgi:hypothetical protein